MEKDRIERALQLTASDQDDLANKIWNISVWVKRYARHTCKATENKTRLYSGRSVGN